MISTFLAAFRRGCCYILLVALACAPAAPVAAATFNVNSPADGNGTHDATPGDGICETVAGNGACTLRAAIEETNALAGADTINLPPNVTYTLTTSQSPGIAALEVADSLTINGSNNTIDALGAGAGVLFVKRCIRDVIASSVCTFGSPVVSISGVAFVHGKATQFGGGVQNLASLTLAHCVVSSNKAGDIGGTFAYGGGILNGGTLTLNDCVVTDNNATGPSQCLGGGIRNSGTLTVTNSVISGNSTNGPVTFGGGIENTGNLTIESTAISANTNNGTQGQGGGLAINGGSATFRNSTISGNHSYEGGGVSGGSATLIDSTVSGNLSIENGGGFYVQQNVALYNTTVTENVANSLNTVGSAIGGGIFVLSNHSVTLTNSIVQGNYRTGKSGQFEIAIGDECAGALTSIPPNLLSTDVDSSHCTVTGSFGTGLANFGPLANNGGTTQTHALLDGSAAIDAGNLGGCTDNVGAVLTRDQRGVKRPYGARCDLGSFEAAEIIFRDGFE